MTAAPSTHPDWFALVDTARDRALHPLVMQTGEAQCLVAGKLSPALASSLPYLVRLRPGDALTERWRHDGTGRSWGIQFQSDLALDRLRLHFKKFLMTRLPNGTTALFRFYDPRVFRAYMQGATPEESRPWFNGVACYSVEGEDRGDRHLFHLIDGRLHDGAEPVAGALAPARSHGRAGPGAASTARPRISDQAYASLAASRLTRFVRRSVAFLDRNDATGGRTAQQLEAWVRTRLPAITEAGLTSERSMVLLLLLDARLGGDVLADPRVAEGLAGLPKDDIVRGLWLRTHVSRRTDWASALAFR
jgi:hypothetical protein